MPHTCKAGESYHGKGWITKINDAVNSGESTLRAAGPNVNDG